MKARFHTLDVFTGRRFGGNQLAVFPEAGAIPPAAMPEIAREFNLSETVFVLPPDDPAHTRRVRIFTPGRELSFAGHPTVGTAALLAHLGAVPLVDGEGRMVLEEPVGPVPVTVRLRPGRPAHAVLSASKLPERSEVPLPLPRAALAAVLGLRVEEVLEDERDRAEGWSCGEPFLCIPLRDRAALGRIRVDAARWEAGLAGTWARNLYPLTRDTGDPAIAVQVRMFAPAMGIAEDPATGGAAAALAGYLARDGAGGDATRRWIVAQGIEMGRPSRIEVEADLAAGAITAVRVGGEAVLVSEGMLTLD